MGSNQGSHERSCDTTNTVIGMFENMKLQERDNSKYQTGYGSTFFNVEPSTYQSFINDQIRAIQLSRLKQKQVLSLKQKLSAYRESGGQIPNQYESNDHMMRFQKKGEGVSVESGNGRRRTHSIRPGPLPQQTGSGMHALFLDGSASSAASRGTGVFMLPGGTGAPSKRPGKGCSTVLIPSRVVHALQLHFEQMASMSRPKHAGFPPLHG
ncbi:hypothetical protein TanjilG_17217 [Lupinus angustifolius]|uniref:Uncharacterized protein n=1 Tax=Lupinus angustifolius TaxID=3871 RepID=A0A4P1R0W0_LUPAN|nr:hypothetical protein TanjilG_17217 [Lupinus angustifolius]